MGNTKEYPIEWENPTTLSQAQRIFVRCVGMTIAYAYTRGYELTFGDTYPGKFQHNKSGNHQRGLAIDLNMFIDGEYRRDGESHEELADYFESLHPMCRNGRGWNDANHYELNY